MARRNRIEFFLIKKAKIPENVKSLHHINIEIGKRTHHLFK